MFTKKGIFDFYYVLLHLEGIRSLLGLGRRTRGWGGGPFARVPGSSMTVEERQPYTAHLLGATEGGHCQNSGRPSWPCMERQTGTCTGTGWLGWRN